MRSCVASPARASTRPSAVYSLWRRCRIAPPGRYPAPCPWSPDFPPAANCPRATTRSPPVRFGSIPFPVESFKRPYLFHLYSLGFTRRRVARRTGHPSRPQRKGRGARMALNKAGYKARTSRGAGNRPPRGDGAHDARNNEHQVCARRRDGEAAGSSRGRLGLFGATGPAGSRDPITTFKRIDRAHGVC
jgi:hypothetical protein